MNQASILKLAQQYAGSGNPNDAGGLAILERPYHFTNAFQAAGETELDFFVGNRTNKLQSNMPKPGEIPEGAAYICYGISFYFHGFTLSDTNKAGFAQVIDDGLVSFLTGDSRRVIDQVRGLNQYPCGFGTIFEAAFAADNNAAATNRSLVNTHNGVPGLANQHRFPVPLVIAGGSRFSGRLEWLTAINTTGGGSITMRTHGVQLQSTGN